MEWFCYSVVIFRLFLCYGFGGGPCPELGKLAVVWYIMFAVPAVAVEDEVFLMSRARAAAICSMPRSRPDLSFALREAWCAM